MLLEGILYRSHVRVTAGRDAHLVSSDGTLDLKLTVPRELGGKNGRGTNPEQLFAAGYAASFLWILRLVAADDGIVLPPSTEVGASVGIGEIAGGFGIEVELLIRLPGLTRIDSESLVMRAHDACPYSAATRGNISVRLVLA